MSMRLPHALATTMLRANAPMARKMLIARLCTRNSSSQLMKNLQNINALQHGGGGMPVIVKEGRAGQGRADDGVGLIKMHALFLPDTGCCNLDDQLHKAQAQAHTHIP